jgi:hypothetical protein
MTHTHSTLRNIVSFLLCFALTAATAFAQDTQTGMSKETAPLDAQGQTENVAAARKLGNFYVRPAHPNAITPSVIILEMKPGDTLNDAISIENPTDYEMTLSVRGADSALTAEGEFTVEAMDKIADEFGSWVTFEESTVTLLPKETKEVKYTLHVPEDTPYGVYQGGMAVTQTGNRSGKGVQISTTIAMGAKITVTATPNAIPKLGETNVLSNINTATTTPYFWGSLALFIAGIAYFVYGTIRERKKKQSLK